MAEPFSFKKLLNGSFFSEKNESFLGIDIGASSIKVVQLTKKKGVAILETYGELSLGPYANMEIGRATSLSSEEIAIALKNLLQEAGVTASDCGVSIPLKSSLVFTMEIPSVNSSQLEQIIPIEVRKYIPVPISEVDLDWKIIPKETSTVSSFLGEDPVKDDKKDTLVGENKRPVGEKVDVLIAAIHKETVKKQKEIIRRISLNLKFLEIEIFSTIRAVSGQNMLNFAVLDMGSSVTKLYIIERGVVRDSHIISRGSQDITLNISRSTGVGVSEAEEQKRKIGMSGVEGDKKEVSDIVSTSLSYIFTEVNKSLLSYQKKNNKNIDKLFITGGGSIIKGLDDLAKEQLQISLEIADPFSKVDTPAFLDSLLKEVGPGFAVALGLALRGLK